MRSALGYDMHQEWRVAMNNILSYHCLISKHEFTGSTATYNVVLAAESGHQNSSACAWTSEQFSSPFAVIVYSPNQSK